METQLHKLMANLATFADEVKVTRLESNGQFAVVFKGEEITYCLSYKKAVEFAIKYYNATHA